MNDMEIPSRDLGRLVVPRVGRLLVTGNAPEPCRLLDPVDDPVNAVDVFFRDLLAMDRAVATVYSYGNDLLRWFRFLWAVDVSWDRATRVEARDFALWLGMVSKHGQGRLARAVGTPNPVTGKPVSSGTYRASTRAHTETVLRSFYDLHRDIGTGPLVNPFPLDRSRRAGRANAHHNPMQPYRNERSGLYRPTVAKKVPRSIPDEKFNELFAALTCHRDRALVAFYVSTGARASELLGCAQGDVDPGQQLVNVVRKGTRAVQQVPASPDAFVWLRLYQQQMYGLVPIGRRHHLWWTLRNPLRPLTYHAARAALNRAQEALGSNWTLHDFRHTAAYRMARDPDMPLSDVQWVLGHAHLTTTQIYLTPHVDEVISNVRAHHQRQTQRSIEQPAPPPAVGYRSETLDVLFGGCR